MACQRPSRSMLPVSDVRATQNSCSSTGIARRFGHGRPERVSAVARQVRRAARVRPANSAFVPLPRLRHPRQRRGWDSNPRYPEGYPGFRDRCIQPLCHLSRRSAGLFTQTHERSTDVKLENVFRPSTPITSIRQRVTVKQLQCIDSALRLVIIARCSCNECVAAPARTTAN